MRYGLILLAGVTALAFIFQAHGVGPDDEEGFVVASNLAPHYGDTVTMTYHVERRYRQMVGALLCSQNGHYVEIFETSLDSHSNDGTYSDTISEPYPPNLPPFDKTQPASCIAYVFREPQSARASGGILTNVLSFEVTP